MLGQPSKPSRLLRRITRNRDADAPQTIDDASDQVATATATEDPATAGEETVALRPLPVDKHGKRHPEPVEDCVECADRSQALLIDHITAGSSVTLDHPQLMTRHRRILSYCSTPGRECPDREACSTGYPCAVVHANQDPSVAILAPYIEAATAQPDEPEQDAASPDPSSSMSVTQDLTVTDLSQAAYIDAALRPRIGEQAREDRADGDRASR